MSKEIKYKPCKFCHYNNSCENLNKVLRSKAITVFDRVQKPSCYEEKK